MDKSYSEEYFKSSRRRTGGFLVTKGPFMKPFPAPYLAEVAVFLPPASSPTMGSRVILGFFGRWPCFFGSFLFVDGSDELVPLGS